jgi:hypothetical protein
VPSAAELAGNVLRGGSWNNNRDNARCAYRNDNNPDNDNDNNGFRLATRASRPPEMRRDALSRSKGDALSRSKGDALSRSKGDALSRSGGHGAEVFKENDRPVPGSP